MDGCVEVELDGVRTQLMADEKELASVPSAASEELRPLVDEARAAQHKLGQDLEAEWARLTALTEDANSLQVTSLPSLPLPATEHCDV